MIVTVCLTEPRYPVKGRCIGARLRGKKQGSKQDPESAFHGMPQTS